MTQAALETHDVWLNADAGLAALVFREFLIPVEGPDGVVFPPTFAASEDKSFKGGYNIDEFDRHENVCLIDSVGAQANRIEPLFKRPPYSHLVPQVVIKVRDDKRVNLLDAGHRAGDALVRFSKVGEDLWNAFRTLLDSGDAEDIAKIAPTSLVFGVWDSRGTQAKVPRVFRSVVRAFKVRPLTRSAQYNPAIAYVDEAVLSDLLDKGKGDENPLSREGFKHNPAVNTPGGVIVDGEMRRDVTINLSAIRMLRGSSADRTIKLQRYVLGLALVAATAHNEERFHLREGCLLRVKPRTPAKWSSVPFEGDDAEIVLDDEEVLAYATRVAQDFEVGGSREEQFDVAAADAWLKLSKKEQDKRRRTGPVTRHVEPATAEVIGAASDTPGRKPRRKT